MRSPFVWYRFHFWIFHFEMIVNELNKYQLDFVGFVDRKRFHWNIFRLDLIRSFFSTRNFKYFQRMKFDCFTSVELFNCSWNDDNRCARSKTAESVDDPGDNKCKWNFSTLDRVLFICWRRCRTESELVESLTNCWSNVCNCWWMVFSVCSIVACSFKTKRCSSSCWANFSWKYSMEMREEKWDELLRRIEYRY